jgi:hypothetical protein
MTETEDHANYIAWLKKKGLAYDHHRTDQRPTNTKGHPDFEVYEDGRVLFLEMKKLGGKISKDQEKRIAELKSAGMMVRIAFSSTEAISYTEHWRHMPLMGHPAKPLDVQGVQPFDRKGKIDSQ